MIEYDSDSANEARMLRFEDKHERQACPGCGETSMIQGTGTLTTTSFGETFYCGKCGCEWEG